MMTIKEYAGRQGVTYEAVRQQISRNRKELEGHIIRKGRVRYLDEAAVAYLDQLRLDNPVIQSEKARADLVEQLQAENEALKRENAELRSRKWWQRWRR